MTHAQTLDNPCSETDVRHRAWVRRRNIKSLASIARELPSEKKLELFLILMAKELVRLSNGSQARCLLNPLRAGLQ